MRSTILNVGAAIALAAFVSNAAMAQEPPPDPVSSLGHLKSVAIPLPDLTGIVKNMDRAIELGKAFFWDTQAGSDGQACTSCHFKAGADPRITNQINPSMNAGDSFFDLRGNSVIGGDNGHNETMTEDDFPFLRLSDPSDRHSSVDLDTNDVMSSAGTFAGDFIKLTGKPKTEVCGDANSLTFHNHYGIAARKVEPRNTPTIFNAVYFFDNFWEGRAKNAFNGVDPFGIRTINNKAAARILVKNSSGDAEL